MNTPTQTIPVAIDAETLSGIVDRFRKIGKPFRLAWRANWPGMFTIAVDAEPLPPIIVDAPKRLRNEWLNKGAE